MKVIVAGSRNVSEFRIVSDAMFRFPGSATEVVSGCAKGVDTFGEIWARKRNVPIKQFPADWKTYGKSAGVIRNKQMADYADALVAIWDGESRGTKNMIEEMEKLGKPVYVHRVSKLEIESGVSLLPEEKRIKHPIIFLRKPHGGKSEELALAAKDLYDQLKKHCYIFEEGSVYEECACCGNPCEAPHAADCEIGIVLQRFERLGSGCGDSSPSK